MVVAPGRVKPSLALPAIDYRAGTRYTVQQCWLPTPLTGDCHVASLDRFAPLFPEDLDRGRYEIHPDWNKKGKAEEQVLGTGRRGADFYDKPDGELLHLTNWVECIRSRKQPSAPAEAGVGAASAAHLANQALRTGQAAVWKA